MTASARRACATSTAAFLTHWHHDHVGGIDDLGMVAHDCGFTCHLTAAASERFAREKPYLQDRLDTHGLDHGDPVSVADATVTPIPVAHDRPEFDTLAFRIDTADGVVVYAPDFGAWGPERPGGQAYRDADLAILEATSVLAPSTLDELDPSEDPVTDANADRTVLTHLNEHHLARHTETLETDVESQGYELGRDFATYVVTDGRTD